MTNEQLPTTKEKFIFGRHKSSRSKKSKVLNFIVLAVAVFILSGYVYTKMVSVFQNSIDLRTFSSANITSYLKGFLRPKPITNSLETSQKLVEEESSVIDVVDKVSPSVVSIVVKRVGFDFFTGPVVSEDGIGTGFIVDSSGLIVTNSHVVNDLGNEYSVILSNGTTYEVTDIHLDEPTDLALIQVTATNLPVVEFGDSEKVKVGQTAIAIGNALGQFSNTVTRGVVSGVARELTASGGFGDLKTYESVLQTDAALNPGNSGGPLLNSAGQVIGINVATTRGADNIGFAIPVNTLKPLLETFLTEGRIVRPFIGVSYSIITKELATVRDLPRGVFVSRVLPDSPADKAGIKRGDILTTFNGLQLDESNTLSKLVRDSKVGTSVKIELVRDNKTQSVNVVLEETPDLFQ
ncbi:MAG: trypsin-like peptidase domain-containing protein [Patescibacteria group bacterium]|uniref:Trypsin-like peptidase domain-containing protein n=1 Tax=candidate division WWE3 bacterium TaxID=2053526 RepID=A0A955EC06_UNCKA|nr:trypsin-like peptidase domain-containing protein [candidate division WWE3 bacterium]